jgi:very-short-patch-repair endonuclease
MNSPSPLAGEGLGRGVSFPSATELLARAKAMRAAPTDAERHLWQILRGKRLSGYKFKRQQRIGTFIADFVCFGGRLIIEADGGQHSQDADGRRDAYLAGQGFRILRFWNNDILNNEEGVAQSILDALSTPLPNPSPDGERG